MTSIPPSPKIRNLPDEILLLIVEHVERESLPSFILVSRRIHPIGTLVLYRFIEYSPPRIGIGKPGLVELKYGASQFSKTNQSFSSFIHI